jgi:hypothetical protein
MSDAKSRARHFRARATECKTLAGMWDPEMAARYRKMAATYEQLAEVEEDRNFSPAFPFPAARGDDGNKQTTTRHRAKAHPAPNQNDGAKALDQAQQGER